VNIYGTVSAPNPASERLHESLGFTHVFTDYKTGWKLGKWHDLIFYRLQLAPAEGEPGPVTPFPELDAGAVREIYERRAAEMGGRTR
jgi:phosphinothricin N-acetyltransferase